MTPPRVAFVLHIMQVAGAEVLVYETIQRLGRRITPHVFCLDGIGPLGERLISEGVPVTAFGRKPGLDWGLVPRIASAMRQHDIQVVHAHQYTPFFYSAIAARVSGRRPRVIFTEHGRHYPDIVSARRRVINNVVLARFADDITAVCDFSARALSEKDGFPKARITVVPNGIELDRYEPTDRAALRRTLGLDPSRRYVTIVARFHPVKDHATLIRAFHRVASEFADVDLLLVGDGPLRPALEAQIGQAGLDERVRLLGVRQDVADILRASNVFVLSSVSEAASITLLEAMASGLPVVVTDVGGNPELVRSDIDGLLVPRGDDARMAQALARLLHDRNLAASMGTSAARRVRDEFRMDQTIERYARLYNA